MEPILTPGDADGLPMHHAARFHSDRNALEVNMFWSGLALARPALPEGMTATDINRITNYISSRHALRLVERVLLHEHSIWLLPDGRGPELTNDALTAAAHWNTVELHDAKRVINGYLSGSNSDW